MPKPRKIQCPINYFRLQVCLNNVINRSKLHMRVSESRGKMREGRHCAFTGSSDAVHSTPGKKVLRAPIPHFPWVKSLLTRLITVSSSAWSILAGSLWTHFFSALSVCQKAGLRTGGPDVWWRPQDAWVLTMEGAENGETDTKGDCHPNCYHCPSGLTNLYDSQCSLVPILGHHSTLSENRQWHLSLQKIWDIHRHGLLLNCLFFRALL